MSKLLSTGEMLDQLKIGEVAVSVDSHVVKRLANGEIVSANKDNEIYVFNVILTEPFLKTKWRIQPNHVSYFKAMKALKENKTALFHHDDIEYEFKRDTDIAFLLEGTGFTINDLIHGKWTIEEEKI